GEAARQPDPMAFYEIHGADHRGRAIDLAQVFNVQVAHQVGARHGFGEDVADRVFAFDGFGQRQAAAFGTVRCGRLAGDRLDDPVDVVERNAQTRMQPILVHQSALEELRVNQSTNQRRGQGAYPGKPDLFLDLERDLMSGFGSEIGFAHQRVGYSLRVE